MPHVRLVNLMQRVIILSSLPMSNKELSALSGAALRTVEQMTATAGTRFQVPKR